MWRLEKGKAMALIKSGGGVTDISGGFGGVYFHRDRFGLHTCRKPRTIQRRTTAQAIQRRAYALARNFSTDPRAVSYNIHRVLNGLAPQDPPADYRPDL